MLFLKNNLILQFFPQLWKFNRRIWSPLSKNVSAYLGQHFSKIKKLWLWKAALSDELWCLDAGNEQFTFDQSFGHLRTSEIWIKGQCKTRWAANATQSENRESALAGWKSPHLMINVPSRQGLVLEFYPTSKAVPAIVPPRLDIMFHSCHTSGLPTRVVPHYLGPGSVLRSRDSGQRTGEGWDKRSPGSTRKAVAARWAGMSRRMRYAVCAAHEEGFMVVMWSKLKAQ